MLFTSSKAALLSLASWNSGELIYGTEGVEWLKMVALGNSEDTDYSSAFEEEPADARKPLSIDEVLRSDLPSDEIWVGSESMFSLRFTI